MFVPGLSTLLTAVAALAAVLVLIWLASRAARLGGLAPRRPGGHTLVVRDAIALDGRRRLHLVRCGEREVLLLTGGAQDVAVGWLDTPAHLEPGAATRGEDPASAAAASQRAVAGLSLAEVMALSPQPPRAWPVSASAPAPHQHRPHPRRVTWLALLLLLAPLAAAHAQSVNIDLGTGGQAGATSRIIQLTALVTVLSLAPSLLVMVTAFTRIIIVLSLLRTALATQSTPPNMVLVGLALFLTFFVMQPTLNEAWTMGIAPMEVGKIGDIEGIRRAIEPFHHFMIVNLRSGDLRFFLDLAHLPAPALPDQAPWRAVVPAFLVGELRRAFEMGFLLFLPFLVIDMVVASVLMSLGMMMLPPSVVSLPFKLIFFVLVDGWRLVAGSLVQSFIGQ